MEDIEPSYPFDIILEEKSFPHFGFCLSTCSSANKLDLKVKDKAKLLESV
jgi:hypothetical protein